jgi:excinuclease ABC subunit C
MRTASETLDYEKAAELRDRLYALQTMEERVTVREIKRGDLPRSLAFTTRLEELKNVLGLEKWPIVIEGFDISDISGKEAVGSMVRFQNGRPDKNNYRKFMIKTVSGIDDYSMIKEVVARRYRHLRKEMAELPDLVLIDGGKGQLSAAREALSEAHVKIPVVSLAKREEEVFVPGMTEPLKLDKDSPALQLLQSVRDEAHRFAISYHHVRRRKSVGIERGLI